MEALAGLAAVTLAYLLGREHSRTEVRRLRAQLAHAWREAHLANAQSHLELVEANRRRAPRRHLNAVPTERHSS